MHAVPAVALPAPLSSLWVRALIEAVEIAGLRPAQFLQAAGIASDRFAHAYEWVEVEEFDRLLALATELTGDPAFGLHWVQRSPMNKFDVFAMIATHAPSARHALGSVLTFQRILGKRPELEAVERAGSLLLRCTPRGTALGQRIRAEVMVYGILRLLRYAGAPDDAVRRVSFAHAAPPYVAEYTRAFPLAPRFARETSLEIEASWLDRPLGGANTELYQVLEGQAQRVLGRIERGDGYARRVRDYVGGVLPHCPAMPEVARALKLSVRSLRRRLDDEGWSFTRVVEEAQQVMAHQLLADSARTVKQVGYEVGFASTAAFVRAFKRWTGASPSVYRASL